MIVHLTYLYQFNLQNAQRLVADVAAAQMASQPGGVINHPAWSLGHLVVSSNHLGQFLGLESSLPDGWSKTFKTGGEPSGELSAYPTKNELLDALTSQHARNTEAIKIFDTARFAEPHPNENTRKYFPSIGDMVIFMMTAHEMNHLGQIAAWRRAMGLGGGGG